MPDINLSAGLQEFGVSVGSVGNPVLIMLSSY